LTEAWCERAADRGHGRGQASRVAKILGTIERPGRWGIIILNTTSGRPLKRMKRVETHLPNLDTAPRSARDFLRSTLGTWQLDGFGEVTELLTSELVANVVCHVGSPMTLRVTLNQDRVRVEVDDPSTETPELKSPGPDESDGRGILFVDSLANAWGSEATPTGKTVWFEIDVSTATQEMHGQLTTDARNRRHLRLER
jgi:hypothetical protein